MKMVFKLSFALALVGLLASVPREASAETTYFTPRSVLAEFFPKSDKVTYIRFTPTRDQRAAIAKQLGYALSRKTYVIYVALTAGQVDGYAFIDDQMGQHLPITFAVQLTASGAVARQEIMVYREPRGDEVRDARFRKQFEGKTVDDPIRANKDIDCISGATISSHAIAIGVKRAVVLFDAATAGGQTTLVAKAKP